MERNNIENIDVANVLNAVLGILPFGVVVCDRDSNILFYNENFTYTLSFKSASELSVSTNKTHNLLDIVDATIAEQLSNVFERVSGEMLDRFTINRLEYTPSIYLINDNMQYVLIMRNCVDGSLMKEELAERLEVVINENHDMVRKIGQFLGESSVKRVKVLNSFIKTLR